MSRTAKANLGWALLMGCLLGVPFTARDGNPVWMLLGATVLVVLEVAGLAWRARKRRNRPWVRGT